MKNRLIAPLSARTSALAVFVMIAASVVAVGAEYYKLSGIKKIDKDLYKTSNGVYVETKYCYHYTYGEDAVLKWEGKYGTNTIIWDDDSTCTVVDFWKK